MHALITGVMARCTEQEWRGRFAGHDVPFQTVLTPHEASRTEHVQARGLVREQDGARHLPFPALLDGQPCGRLDRLAPEPGADAESILRELGFSATRSIALKPRQCGAAT